MHILVESSCTSVETSINVAVRYNSTSKLKKINENYEGLGTCEAVRMCVCGLPVIVFSSASHYPVINITPRECRAPIPLHVAFNQSSAGYYNAVTFKNDPPIPSTSQWSATAYHYNPPPTNLTYPWEGQQGFIQGGAPWDSPPPQLEFPPPQNLKIVMS